MTAAESPDACILEMRIPRRAVFGVDAETVYRATSKESDGLSVERVLHLQHKLSLSVAD
jgi:hypothetical protein